MIKTVYVAGPMRGIPYYNFPLFDTVAEELKQRGYEPVSPADLDRGIGFDAMKLPLGTDWVKIPDGFDMTACINRDIAAVLHCHCVLLLPGWELSRGTRAEKALADWAGIPCVTLYVYEDYLGDLETAVREASLQ